MSTRTSLGLWANGSVGSWRDGTRAIRFAPTVMLRFLEEHEPLRRVMERVNRLLMGGAADPRARVQAAMLASAIAGAVIHPLVLNLDDERLRSELLKQARKLLPRR